MFNQKMLFVLNKGRQGNKKKATSNIFVHKKTQTYKFKQA